MPNVHTLQRVTQAWHAVRINGPFLEGYAYRGLEGVVARLLEQAQRPWPHHDPHLRNEGLLLERLGRLKGRLVVFCAASSVVDEEEGRRYSIDPLSPLNLTFRNLEGRLASFGDEGFLEFLAERVVLWPVAAVDEPVRYARGAFEDALELDVPARRAAPAAAGNYFVRDGLLDMRVALSHLDDYLKRIHGEFAGDLEAFKARLGLETRVLRDMLAHKYGLLHTRLELPKTYVAWGIADGVPAYMAKTGVAFKVLSRLPRHAALNSHTAPLLLGLPESPVANLKAARHLNLAHPTAQELLIGFLMRIYEQTEKRRVQRGKMERTGVRIPVLPVGRCVYYPYIACERVCERDTTGNTCAASLVDRYAEPDREFLRRDMEERQTSVARVEVWLRRIFERNYFGIVGRPKGRYKVFASQGAYRGRIPQVIPQLTMPQGPIAGRHSATPSPCAIEAELGLRLPDAECARWLARIAQEAPALLDRSRYTDAFEERFIKRGTMVHDLTFSWLPNFVHDKTVAPLFGEPTPSTAFAERLYVVALPVGNGTRLFSFHPDTAFLIDNDVFVLDLKTAMTGPAPWIKNQQQVGLYGDSLFRLLLDNRVVEEAGRIQTVLLYNVHLDELAKTSEFVERPRHRRQKPIPQEFARTDPLIAGPLERLEERFAHRDRILADPALAARYKRWNEQRAHPDYESQRKSVCQKCYPQTKSLCDFVVSTLGVPLESVLGPRPVYEAAAPAQPSLFAPPQVDAT